MEKEENEEVEEEEEGPEEVALSPKLLSVFTLLPYVILLQPVLGPLTLPFYVSSVALLVALPDGWKYYTAAVVVPLGAALLLQLL